MRGRLAAGWGKRALLLLGIAGACTPSFQSPSQVVDLRVLAIRAEPAEAHVDLDAGTAEPVAVRALIADPQPRQPLVVEGRVCFPTDSGRCDGSPAIDPQTAPRKAMEQQPLAAQGVRFGPHGNCSALLGVDDVERPDGEPRPRGQPR